MKIALFSDIHANLPALEAMLADIDSRKPDVVYCLGDLVGYNVWPNEVIAEIRRRGIPTITGNYDFGIGRASDDCGCVYREEVEKANGKVSIAYTNEVISADERAFLRTLPSHIRLEFDLSNDPERLWAGQDFLNLLLVHGSPRRINEYLFEDREDKSLLQLLQKFNADVLCFGHTHKPYHRILTEETETGLRYRHAINIGSVGKPKDGDPRAGYVLLTLSETSPAEQPDALGVEFVRVAYDVERAAKAVEESPLPDAYAEALRVAK
ncbi:MAG: metallophosphoesterase family protein [Sphingobacteriaceae bacterium]|nr:metallophosphoesterase family protein [Cytophagaceae bacterium]